MTKSRKPTAKDKEAWGMVYGVLMGVYGIWPIRPYDCRSHSADEDLYPLCCLALYLGQASIQDEVTAAIVAAWSAGETNEGLERMVSAGGRSLLPGTS